VFGMPKMAYKLGGAKLIVPLEQIPSLLVRALQRP